MNKRKNINFSELYKTLDKLMVQKLSETEPIMKLAKPFAAAPRSVRRSWPPSICGSGILR